MIKADSGKLEQSLQRDRALLEQSEQQLFNGHFQHSYSKHDIIWRNEDICLRAFLPDKPNGKHPLVLCYALVNRPWILDLTPGSSLVQALVSEGFSVYLIDWGNPVRCQRYLGMEHYIGKLMHRCIQIACNHLGSAQADLVGICQGGVFSLCYAALHPERIAKLVTLVTPIDFHAPDFTLSHLYRQTNVEQLVRAYGNIPGALVTQVFTSLQPTRLGYLKHLSTASRLTEKPEAMEQYMLMERWLNDCPDLAGKTLQQFVELFFRDNVLLDRKFEMGDLSIDMNRLKSPVLNIYGNQDHLVSPDASMALESLCTHVDYRAVSVPAGHIGTLMGSKALKTVPAAIKNWLQAPSE